MKILKIISFGLTFYKLNKQLVGEGRVIMDEGMDVLKSIGDALKDNSITTAEKKIIVKEIKEFSKASINAIDSIVIPNSKQYTLTLSELEYLKI